MHAKKRLLSIVLALSLCVSLLSGAASAVSAAAFSDVSEDSWYYEYVDYVTQQGYFQGTSDTTFEPEVTMTRAMFVTVLARMAGVQVDNSITSFADVTAGQWYAGAVAWAATNGIAEGVGGHLFLPDQNVTRQDMCVFMSRFISWYQKETGKICVGTPLINSFTDQSSIDSWATSAVEICRQYGLVNGYDDGSFRPLDSSTRSQVAAVVSRLSWITYWPSTTLPEFNWGGSTETEESAYTITYYDENGEKLGSESTEKTTSTAKSFTTWSAEDAAFETGNSPFAFLEWNTKLNGTGTAYEAGEEYTTTENLKLYAQWAGTQNNTGAAEIDENDLIGKAMDETLRAFGGYVEPDYSGETRTGAITITVDVTDEMVASIVEIAAEFAVGILDDYDNVAAYVKGIVAGLEEALSVPEGCLLSRATIDAIVDSIKSDASDVASTVWGEFRDSDNNYYTGDFEVTVGDVSEKVTVDQENYKTEIESGGVEALATALAQEMYAAVQDTYTNWADEVTATGTVTITFTDPENEYRELTANYPHIYELEVAVVVQGGDLLEYKYDGEDNVKVHITADVQAAYKAAIADVVKAGLSQTSVQKQLSEFTGSVASEFEKSEIFDSIMKAASALDMNVTNEDISGIMAEWVLDNCDPADMFDSILFQAYWNNVEDPAYDNAAIYDLVDQLAAAAGNYVVDLIDEKNLGDFGLNTIAGVKTVKDFNSALALVEDIIKDVDLGTVTTLGEKYPAVYNYVVASIVERCASETNVTAGMSASKYEEEMHEEIDEAVSDAIIENLSDSEYVSVLKSISVIRTIDGMSGATLEQLNDLLKTGVVSDILATSNITIPASLTDLIDRLPDATVTVGGVELKTSDLTDFAGATTVSDLSGALDSLLANASGLGSLSLSSFVNGLEVTVTDGSRTFTFMLHITID